MDWTLVINILRYKSGSEASGGSLYWSSRPKVKFILCGKKGATNWQFNPIIFNLNSKCWRIIFAYVHASFQPFEILSLKRTQYLTVYLNGP